MHYEVLFYNGWLPIPAYQVVCIVAGNTPEQAMEANIEQITQKVRNIFYLAESDVPDEKIQRRIYVLRDDGLVSVNL